MKHVSLVLAFMLVTAPANGQCYADYKAKRDNPLRLHYGVVEISGACTAQAAAAEIARRIGPAGWQLLNVVSVFGPEGLAERKDSAGQFFLRF